MKIPKGHNEQQALEAIERVVVFIAPAFIFGPYTSEDIRQEARLMCLKVLETERYDPSRRPLESFLYRHVRNRLINFRRDHYYRNDPPCSECHSGSPCGKDGTLCKRYSQWSERNRSKVSLMQTLDLRDRPEARESDAETPVLDKVEYDDLVRLLDEKLPVELRSAYVRMLDGASVECVTKRKVRQAVADIMREAGIEPPESED